MYSSSILCIACWRIITLLHRCANHLVCKKRSILGCAIKTRVGTGCGWTWGTLSASRSPRATTSSWRWESNTSFLLTRFSSLLPGEYPPSPALYNYSSWHFVWRRGNNIIIRKCQHNTKMASLPVVKESFSEQSILYRCQHYWMLSAWLMCKVPLWESRHILKLSHVFINPFTLTQVL